MIATCRACGRHFGSDMSAQSIPHPRLCVDCACREVAYHGYHAPGVRCVDHLLGTKRLEETA